MELSTPLLGDLVAMVRAWTINSLIPIVLAASVTTMHTLYRGSTPSTELQAVFGTMVIHLLYAIFPALNIMIPKISKLGSHNVRTQFSNNLFNLQKGKLNLINP